MRCRYVFVIVALFAALLGAQEPPSSDVEELKARAEQEDANAQLNLGVMYAKGQGVPQDYVQAHKWINLAASRASGPDAAKYGKARDRVADKMTPAQVAEAQRLAREWKPKTWEELKGE